MTFRRANDVSPMPGDFVARESAWWRAVGVVITLGMLGFVVWAPPLRGWWLGWLMIGVMTLFVLLFVRQWQKTLSRQNWILRITPRSVLVKFRSYANAHFDESDKVVVAFSLDEIAWAGERRETFISPSSKEDGSSQQYFAYLELGLRNVDVVQLAQHLAEERRRRPPPAMIESLQRDYPVQLVNRPEVDGPVLQIRWRGASNWIAPSIKKTLAKLSQFTTIRELAKTSLDVTGKGNAADGPQLDDEAIILAMAERGELIAAVKLARQCYGCSLAEAKQLVEELRSTAQVDHHQQKG
jgi:ribosomal protein L7/L12